MNRTFKMLVALALVFATVLPASARDRRFFRGRSCCPCPTDMYGSGYGQTGGPNYGPLGYRPLGGERFYWMVFVTDHSQLIQVAHVQTEFEASELIRVKYPLNGSKQSTTNPPGVPPDGYFSLYACLPVGLQDKFWYLYSWSKNRADLEYVAVTINTWPAHPGPPISIQVCNVNTYYKIVTAPTDPSGQKCCPLP